MSDSKLTTFSAAQLSVPPSALRVPADLLFRNTLGNIEAEMMAALIVYMIKEQAKASGTDEWTGVSMWSLGDKANEVINQIRTGGGICLLTTDLFNRGLLRLREAQAITIECHGEGNDAFDVVAVTEEMLKYLRRYIAV